MLTDTWITLAESDVQNSINDSELETNLGIAQASGQSNAAIVAAIIADVSSEVQGYCRLVSPLGPPGTIPAELKNAAIDIILFRVTARVSGANAAVARKPAHDSACLKLEKVARREIFISVPQTLGTTVTSAPTPQIEHRPARGFGYEEERGI